MAFKVALIAYEAEVPGFVREAFEREGIDFVAQRCRTNEELKQYAADADAVWMFSAKHPLTAENLAILERCGAIIRTGSGTDNVPVEEATRRRIVVANTPDGVNMGVSDHAIGLILALGRKILQQDAAVRSGHWVPFEIFPTFSWPDARWAWLASGASRELSRVSLQALSRRSLRSIHLYRARKWPKQACSPPVSSRSAANRTWFPFTAH